MKCQKESDDRREEDGGAIDIESLDIFLPALALDSISVGGLEEEEDYTHGNCADRKIDIETPSPGSFVGKDSSQKRSGDRCNAYL